MVNPRLTCQIYSLLAVLQVDSSSTEQVSSTSESYDEPVSSNNTVGSLLKLLLSDRFTIKMQFLRLFTFFALLLASGLCAPVETHERTPSPPSDGSKTPPSREHGEFVGVRPGAYEKKTKEDNLKSISIHPGVVVGGPDAETGKYSVAMISKKLPHDPPQAPIEQFHPASTIYGKIALSPPKEVRPEDMKSWKNDKSGEQEKHMTEDNLTNLKKAMEPHVDWRPPTPPPKPPTPPPKTPTPPPKTPTPPPAKSPNRRPVKKGQQANAHASASRHTTPSRQGGSRHPTPPKQGAAGSGHPGTAGGSSGASSWRKPAAGGPNQQNAKAPRRSNSPGAHPHSHSQAKNAPRRSSSPGAHPHSHSQAKNAPRRSSSPGPHPHSHPQAKKPAHGGGAKPARNPSPKRKA